MNRPCIHKRMTCGPCAWLRGLPIEERAYLGISRTPSEIDRMQLKNRIGPLSMPCTKQQGCRDEVLEMSDCITARIVKRISLEISKRLERESYKESEKVRPQPEPRYDEVFWEGTRWLDGQ